MIELFKQRQRRFRKQINSYLPYVFNDHFVLVLLFLLGFVLFQYSQLLQSFPDNPLGIVIGLFCVVLMVLSFGSISLYLEPADKQFLLAKETELIQLIGKAKKRAMIIGIMGQSLVMTFFLPIFLKLGVTVFYFMVLLLVLAVIKGFIVNYKSKIFLQHSSLVWDKGIQYEIKRKQSILKFFSLFTTVKGVSTTVKRRLYMDVFLALVPKKHDKMWLNLYLRAFLRGADYLPLTLRFFVLAILSLVFISQVPIAVGLACIFNYLLLFQLLGLYNHYDYQYLASLYPVDEGDRKTNLQLFLRGLIISLTLVEMLVSWSFLGAGILLTFSTILLILYLPYKLKKIID